MTLPKATKYGMVLLCLVVAGAVLGGFLAFGPPQLYAKSSTPEFCGRCHVMETEYEAWFHAGAHRRISCVDCHLPNDTKVRHLIWKGIDGMKDALAFYGGRVPENIVLSEHGTQILQENCQRCHAETMARVNEERQCWFCHRRLSHKRTGAMATWTP